MCIGIISIKTQILLVFPNFLLKKYKRTFFLKKSTLSGYTFFDFLRVIKRVRIF